MIEANVCHVTSAGREIYVGISGRTNSLGAQAVAKAFPEYSTTIVKVPSPAIHLKDCVTMAGIEVFAVAKSEAAQKIFQVGSDMYIGGAASGASGHRVVRGAQTEHTVETETFTCLFVVSLRSRQ